MNHDLEEVRALVNPFGYRAQWFQSCDFISVWPRNVEFCRNHNTLLQ